MKRGKTAEARAAFERALQLKADYADANNSLGALMAQNGDVPGAIERFRAALAAKPQFADAMNNLGFALFQTGDAAQARELYEKALALQPDFPEALNNLGIFYGTPARSRSRARRTFSRRSTSAATYGEAANNLALVLDARGETDKAIDGAAATAPGEPVVRDGLRDAVPHLSQGREPPGGHAGAGAAASAQSDAPDRSPAVAADSRRRVSLAEVMSHDAVAPPIPSVAREQPVWSPERERTRSTRASRTALPFPSWRPRGPTSAVSIRSFSSRQIDRRSSCRSSSDKFTDLAAWQPTARATVLEHLSYAPPPVPPAAEILRREDRGDYVQEYLTFQTTPDIRVPAYVLIPKSGNRPAPGIVALHCHGGFYVWGKDKLVESDHEHPALTEYKQELYHGRSIASELARRGYVVIVIDAFYWGERRMVLDDDPASYREPSQMTKEDVANVQPSIAAGRAAGGAQSVHGRHHVAGRRALGRSSNGRLSGVATRGRSCADSRASGLSMGGYRSFLLAALEPRIKVAVDVGWMTSFAAADQKARGAHDWACRSTSPASTAIWICRIWPR